jgi:S-methylmethionine-dependent homocysteine/selenocysteine methylase
LSHRGFVEFFQATPAIVQAGAMGTELQRRGFATVLPLWSAGANLQAQSLVTRIHLDYLAAGADLSITNTFRTTPRCFAKTGHAGLARPAMRNAVAAAKEAQLLAGGVSFIGGSMAPLEDCYAPELVPDDTALRAEHGLHAAWLAEEGVDFLLAETINAVREAAAMARAASDTGLPFIMSFLPGADGRLPDGSSLAEAVAATDAPGRIAVSLNCRKLAVLDDAYRSLRAVYDGAVGLYANGEGRPHDAKGWMFTPNNDDVTAFVDRARAWRAAGARIIGGCCGTTPDYIRALRAMDKAWVPKI